VRFLVLGGNGAEATGDDVTSVLATGNGDALRRVASRMRRQGLAVTVWGSDVRTGRAGRVRLLFDIEGHVTDKRVGKALDALTGCGGRLNVLGSYPKSRDI
jgi:prephenate dehydratase